MNMKKIYETVRRIYWSLWIAGGAFTLWFACQLIYLNMHKIPLYTRGELIYFISLVVTSIFMGSMEIYAGLKQGNID